MKTFDKNSFDAKVAEVRAALKQGLVPAATSSLNEAWELAGQNKAFRTVAHGLGNEIQAVIFEQYMLSEAN